MDSDGVQRTESGLFETKKYIENKFPCAMDVQIATWQAQVKRKLGGRSDGRYAYAYEVDSLVVLPDVDRGEQAACNADASANAGWNRSAEGRV